MSEGECAVLDGDVQFTNTATPLDFTTRLEPDTSAATTLPPQYTDVCRPIDTAHGQLLDCRIQTKDSSFSDKNSFVPEANWLNGKANYVRDDEQGWLAEQNSRESSYVSEGCENEHWLRRTENVGRPVVKGWLSDCAKPNYNSCDRNENWVRATSEHPEFASEQVDKPWLPQPEDDKTEFIVKNGPNWMENSAKNGENWLPKPNRVVVKEPSFLIRVSESLIEPDHLLEVKLGRKRARRKKNVDGFKCEFCPLMTLDRNMMLLHAERKGACVTDSNLVHCPGCSNVFYSLVSLRTHLSHDHNMVPKDVKCVLVHLPRVSVSVLIPDPDDKPSCLYDARSQHPAADSFNLTASQTHNENHEELSTKRTLLETYLDKSECSMPPRLSQPADDILENTFNFTAPVSEQLPSIQPENPPPASGLDEPHLLQESQEKMETHITTIVPDKPQENENVSTDHSVQMEVDQHQYIAHHTLYQNDTYHEAPLEELTYVSSENIPVVCLDAEEVIDTHQQTSLASKIEKEIKSNYGYRCGINGCKLRMRSEEKIKYHRRCHEGQMFNCPECCQDQTNWDALSSHLWQLHEIDMELYKCDRCNYRTPSYSRLTNYHRGIHGIERPFLCDICGKGFKTVKQMRNHKTLHRKKPLPRDSYECDVCGHSYNNKATLNHHFVTKHRNVKPFLCNVCGYKTDRKHSLVLHMRRHTGEKPYSCDTCDYTCKDHNALRRHQYKHTGQFMYKCKYCSYKCVQATSLKCHAKRKHPGLEESTIFSCEHCPFETVSRDKYLSHTAAHTQFYSENENYYPHDVGSTDAIVDLSHGPALLNEDGYYEVEQLPDIPEEEPVPN